MKNKCSGNQEKNCYICHVPPSGGLLSQLVFRSSITNDIWGAWIVTVEIVFLFSKRYRDIVSARSGRGEIATIVATNCIQCGCYNCSLICIKQSSESIRLSINTKLATISILIQLNHFRKGVDFGSKRKATSCHSRPIVAKQVRERVSISFH